MIESCVSLNLIVPGLPQPLLAPEKSPVWGTLRKGFEGARVLVEQAADEGADLLVIYSTQWPSVLGHQVQGAHRLQWNHVDPEFHELGSIEYDLSFDGDFAHTYAAAGNARGLHVRAIEFEGFPLDTGTLVALKLLDPKGRLKVCAVSCNMYADRSETILLGKALRDALKTSGRKAVAVAVTGLSARMIPKRMHPSEESISLAGDDEWNRKILEILAEGRLEDVSQLARSFYKEARADQKFKAIWWLSGLNGAGHNFKGQVHAYGSLQGTGAAVVTLTPSDGAAPDQEFDEEDLEYFKGERSVLSAKK